MIWDFADVNPFGGAAGDFGISVSSLVKVILSFPIKSPMGYSYQEDAAVQKTSIDKVVSTDPPYYDNVPYADLSDFFYVWLRPFMKKLLPDIFSTMAVPKDRELVAFPHRHSDDKAQAENFFVDGMTEAMKKLFEQSHPVYPLTIYYAFKQSEVGNQGEIFNTGWESFLEAVIRAGFFDYGNIADEDRAFWKISQYWI